MVTGSTKKIASLILVALFLVQECITYQQYTLYDFRRYPYKKKQKNERKIKTAKSLCELKQICENVYGLDQLKCIRKCMSEKCYEELYGHDELEEGEIDIRYNSFKGCILLELAEKR